MKKTITIHSSHGSLEVCAETGCVLSVNSGSCCVDKGGCYIENIQRFFIDEYIAFYGKLHSDIDIVTIGCWDFECNYMEPENYYRNIADYHKK